MKIGILSDIHGNHYALKAVLKEAEDNNVKKLFIVGDIVGYYYHPEIVMDLLSKWDYIFVKGNHETMLKESIESDKIKAKIIKKYGHGIEFAIEKLSSKQINFLTNAPITLSTSCLNTSFFLSHGVGDDYNGYIYPDTSKDELDKYIKENHTFTIIGHSHYPFIHNAKSGTLINCGSVGQTRAKGSKATWYIIDCEKQKINLMSTFYDKRDLIKEVKEVDQTISYLHEVLMR